MPPIAVECINSWKVKLPEYEIVRWDEDKFDINSTPFTSRAYIDKKYAFVSDYVRLFALQTQGGIYMDIDEMVFKDFSELLTGRKLVAGFETQESVMVGFVASEAENHIIKDFLNIYKRWDLSDKHVEYVANPVIFTELLLKHGLKLNGQTQILDEGQVAIYHRDFFCGYDFSVYKEKITSDTYAVQKYAGTWTDGKSVRSKKMHESLVNIIGEKKYLKLKSLYKRLSGKSKPHTKG